MEHSKIYFQEVKKIVNEIDLSVLEAMVVGLNKLRDRGGRLFILGVGGSAGNASHATNDFRKLCGIESYAPTDNVSELTARTNDEGWETVFTEWLKISKLSKNDALFILSVGGGSREHNVSVNLVKALEFASEIGAKIYGIVGRDGGYTGQLGDEIVLVPTVSSKHITPHTEEFHAIVWHCMVSHPALQLNSTKW